MKGSSLAWNYNYYLDLRFQAKRSYSQFPRSSDLARTRNNLTPPAYTEAVQNLFPTFQQGVPPSKGAPYQPTSPYPVDSVGSPYIAPKIKGG